MTKPIIPSEKLCPSFYFPDIGHHVKFAVIHKIFNFLCDKSDVSPTHKNKVKQNIQLPKENQLMQ